jgi:hypothetical protein
MEGPSSEVVDRYIQDNATPESYDEVARVEADQLWNDTSEGFALYPSGGRRCFRLACGDRLHIEFEIEAPKPLPEATVGITIASPKAEKIVSMSSRVQNVPSEPGPSRLWRVSCDMGRIPLNVGTYYAHVYVGNTGFDYARFSEVFKIVVREHDVFGCGRPLPPYEAWGGMYWAPEWSIRPSSVEAPSLMPACSGAPPLG